MRRDLFFFPIGALLALMLCPACESVCDYDGETCRPKLPNSLPQIELDINTKAIIPITRFLISTNAKLTIFQIPSTLLEYDLPSYDPNCQALTSMPPSYFCNVSVSSTDLMAHGFAAGMASVQAADILSENVVLASNVVSLSLVSSKFIFHLDNPTGAVALPAPKMGLMPGPDKGLQEVEVNTPGIISAAHAFTDMISGNPYNEILTATYMPASKSSPSSISWMVRSDLPSNTTFITNAAVWNTQLTPGMKLALYSDLMAKSNVSATGSNRSLVLTPGMNAVIIASDGSVQAFPNSGGAQMPTTVASANTMSQVLKLGTVIKNQELLVAHTDFSVDRYDLTSWAPLSPGFMLSPPNLPQGQQLDTLGVGDLDFDGIDEVVVASGTTLYIWGWDAGMNQAFLDNMLTGLPEGWVARSIAIGDIDGQNGNDIVVAADNNSSMPAAFQSGLYIFLRDPPPSL